MSSFLTYAYLWGFTLSALLDAEADRLWGAADSPADASPSTDATAVSDAQLSAAEIYAELIPSDVEATQDDLAEALNQAVEAYPVLYAELVNVAIDLALKPPLLP